MSKFDYDLGVIGGGAAGMTVAAGAAKLGAKVLLAERSGRLGGDCLHYGCVPSKTLIKTARVHHQIKRAKDFGLPSVDPGPVDFRQVAARIQSVVQGIQKVDTVERFCGIGVKAVFGETRFVDEHAALIDGQSVSAAKWVVATGSSPAIPPIPGLEDTPYLTNRELYSLDRLPGHLVVLGAGPVGVEMAQAFLRLGSAVTLVHRGAHILGRDDPDLTDDLKALLEAEGLRFVMNAQVAQARRAGDGVALRLDTPRGVEEVTGDALLVSLGRRPNLEGLDLHKAGVAVSDKGVLVDDRMRTSMPHIFACGDVTGNYQFTHAAGYEGGVVVANAVLKYPRRADYSFFPWCTFTDPELAHIGLNETMARKLGASYTVWSEPFRSNDRGWAENERQGRVKLLLGDDGHPLGVQILGHRAGDLVAEWVAVLHGNLSLARLAMATHPYPTLAEINKALAARVMGDTLFSQPVKKALSFFFGLKGRACGEEKAQA